MSETKKKFSDEDLIKLAWEKEQEQIENGEKIRGQFGTIIELNGLDPKNLKHPFFEQ